MKTPTPCTRFVIRAITLSFWALLLNNAIASDTSFTVEYKKALVDIHSNIIRDLAKQPDTLAKLQQATRTETSIAPLIQSDLRWRSSKDLRNKVTQNALAHRFRSLVGNSKFSFAEIMLTDSFGGLLAAFPVTTDFWQGDEKKFIQPVSTADVYISDAEWDESSKAFSFFVSVPISKDGQFLGVLIAGLDVTTAYLVQMPLEDLIKIDVEDIEIK